MPNITALDDIKNVTLEGNPEQREASVRLLKASLPMARELLEMAVGTSPLNPISSAALMAFQSISSLVISAGPRCNIASPSEDIEVRVDDSGNMVYRCHHRPSHEWDLSGKRLP